MSVAVTIAVPVSAAAAGGSISGSITDARQHLPIEGLCVDAVSSATGYYNYYSARTDSMGSYTIANLPSADYLVIFGRCSQTWAMHGYPSGYNQDDWQPVHVDTGLTTPAINAQMEKYGTISGRLTRLSDGSPVRTCVDVNQTNADGAGYRYATQVDDDGRYTVDRVSPADWWVVVASCGSGPKLAPTAYSSSGSRTHATVLHVHDGENLTGIDVALPRAGRVTGRVVDRAGRPKINTPVRIDLAYGGREDFFRMAWDTTTDAHGRYHFNRMAGGTYTIAFGPFAHWRSYYRNVLTRAEAKTFRVNVADTKRLRVQTYRPITAT